MIKKLPWWFKIVAKLILSRLPINYSIWQRVGLFRHGRMDQSDYMIKTFDQHVSASGLKDNLNDKTILELGPGDSVATAILVACYGGRACLVDTGRYAQENMAVYRSLVRMLKEQGIAAPDIENCQSVNDIMMVCDAEYLTGGLNSLAKIDSASIDMIFSHAVLEHVRRREFLDTMKNCRRVLKSDGVCSHRVDLKDHLGGGLNNLRFRENVWESGFFSSSGFYTNRIQYHVMLNYFREAGFDLIVTKEDRWEKLPIRRDQLNELFQSCSDDELGVSGFNVLLRPIGEGL